MEFNMFVTIDKRQERRNANDKRRMNAKWEQRKWDKMTKVRKEEALVVVELVADKMVVVEARETAAARMAVASVMVLVITNRQGGQWRRMGRRRH